MPYRFTIPEGAAPLDQVLNHLGTPKLVAMRQYAHHVMYSAPETTLTPRERETMRMPITAIVGCPICNSARLWRDFPGFSEAPIDEGLYRNAEKFNLDWPGFTLRERILLEFVNAFINHIDELNGDDVLWDKLHANFTETEIGDVIIMCGAWFGVGRGFKALGIGSSCEIATDETMERLRAGTASGALT